MYKLTRNVVLVTESLEGAISPGIKDPVLGVAQGTLGLVFGLVPAGRDLGDKRVLGLGSGLLGLNAAGFEVGREAVSVPVLVGRHGVGIPVLLDDLLEILAVSGGGVWDVVVRQPSLQLRLVPLVVGC